MNYMLYDVVKGAKASGSVPEAKLMEVIEDASGMIEKAQKEPISKECFWKFMRRVHTVLCGPHYNQEFAMWDISMLTWTNRKGEKKTGAYWTLDQVEEASKSLSFPSGTTKYDKYVAFNVFYSDMSTMMSDEQILSAAYKFFFADEDAPAGKVWLYMQSLR